MSEKTWGRKSAFAVTGCAVVINDPPIQRFPDISAYFWCTFCVSYVCYSSISASLYCKSQQKEKHVWGHGILVGKETRKAMFKHIISAMILFRYDVLQLLPCHWPKHIIGRSLILDWRSACQPHRSSASHVYGRIVLCALLQKGVNTWEQ